MFKSKWQKKYEKAMRIAGYHKRFYAERAELHKDDPDVYMACRANETAMADILKAMETIKAE